MVKVGQVYEMRRSDSLPDLLEDTALVVYVGPANPGEYPELDWEAWEGEETFVVWEYTDGIDFLPLEAFKNHSKLLLV